MQVIIPSMTNQIVLESFKYLVQAEIRKHIPDQLEYRFGSQEGFVSCLVMMFGETDDESAELAYKAGKTWLQISEKIVAEKLANWVNALRNPENLDLKALHTAVNDAVENYALEHPSDLIDALKNNL